MTISMHRPVAGQDAYVSVRPAGTEAELAAVLAEVLHEEHVPVDGHFVEDLGADSLTMAQFCARVRKRPDLPSASIKDVYQHPTISSLAAALAPAPVEDMPTAVASGFGEVLAEVLQIETAPVDGHFFDDLGADSMTMAQFCARVRKRDDLPTVSMKEVYQHPTVRSLATALAPAASASLDSDLPATPQEIAVGATTPSATDPSSSVATRAQYFLCGVLQLLSFAGYVYVAAVLFEQGFFWVGTSHDIVVTYLRSVLFSGMILVGAGILPIAAKWILVGRWKGQEIRIWSLGYFRFWLVKTLIRSNPLLLFAGGRSRTSGCSPLTSLYLRALGAKVGRGVAIYSRNFPTCTDLLTLGDGAVIRKDAIFNCYRAHGGMIQTGRVTLGRDAFVGEASVLDIETSLGDGAQLGHASALQAGQTVPAGAQWHGSPAQPTEVDYRGVGPAGCGRLRRIRHSVGQLTLALLVYLPLGIALSGLLLARIPLFPRLSEFFGTEPFTFTNWQLYVAALAMSAVFVFGFLLVGLVFVATVPRLLNLFIEPDKVYRLYGLHYGIHRAIGLFTNLRFFLELFGNSSYILHYLRWLGYDVSLAGQTGCNFGTEVRHETPFAVTVGDGTMVADGLSIINADFSNSSFRVSRATIGAHSFLGNLISYPSQSRTGENCLLATRVLVPTGGEVRENTGLLGAPSFTIPRSVQRDGTFDHLKSQEELRHHLRAKNSYNRRTMGAFLLAQWGFVFGLAVLELPAAEYYDRHRTTWIAVSLVFPVLWALVYRALSERIVTRFRSLRPQFCSIYDPYYWWHERYWKFIMTPTVAGVLNGTPFKNILWRLLGLRIGKRVFDDGSSIPERTLVTVGDDCVINQGSVIQSHSLEDGAFKSQRTVVGAGCTLGVGAFIHYGVTVGDGAELAAGSFLMKGGEVLAGERWGGNPAQEMSGQAALPAARPADSRILAPAGAIPAPVPADAIPAPRTGGRHRAERGRTAADR